MPRYAHFFSPLPLPTIFLDTLLRILLLIQCLLVTLSPLSSFHNHNWASTFFCQLSIHCLLFYPPVTSLYDLYLYHLCSFPYSTYFCDLLFHNSYTSLMMRYILSSIVAYYFRWNPMPYSFFHVTSSRHPSAPPLISRSKLHPTTFVSTFSYVIHSEVYTLLFPLFLSLPWMLSTIITTACSLIHSVLVTSLLNHHFSLFHPTYFLPALQLSSPLQPIPSSIHPFLSTFYRFTLLSSDPLNTFTNSSRTHPSHRTFLFSSLLAYLFSSWDTILHLLPFHLYFPIHSTPYPFLHSISPRHPVIRFLISFV